MHFFVFPQLVCRVIGIPCRVGIPNCFLPLAVGINTFSARYQNWYRSANSCDLRVVFCAMTYSLGALLHRKGNALAFLRLHECELFRAVGDPTAFSLAPGQGFQFGWVHDLSHGHFRHFSCHGDVEDIGPGGIQCHELGDPQGCAGSSF